MRLATAVHYVMLQSEILIYMLYLAHLEVS